MEFGIVKLLKKIFSKKQEVESEVSIFPTYDSDKPYKKMNFKERVRYKRWLSANNMWDGEIVMENLQKHKNLNHETKARLRN